MNTRRIIFWTSFIIVLGLIIWGLVVAMNRDISSIVSSGTPMPVTEVDHIRGPEDAPVTLIEYSDLECPACAAYMPIVERVVAEASTTVRFVYRHFPLYPSPHRNALLASQAAEAAALQGKFWDMYLILFENQQSWTGKPLATARASFESYAERIGLDVERFKADIDSEEVIARVQRDRDDSKALNLMGTPSFFVNGKAINNPRSYEEFVQILQDAAQADTQ